MIRKAAEMILTVEKLC